MTLSLFFWIIYIVGVLLSGYWYGFYRRESFTPTHLILWILIGLLGYKVFA